MGSRVKNFATHLAYVVGLLCAFWLFAFLTLGLPRLAIAAIFLLVLTLLMGGILQFQAWRKGYIQGARAFRTSLLVLVATGPPIVLITLSDPHLVDVAPVFFALFAISAVSDSTLDSAFRRAASRLCALSAITNQEIPKKLWFGRLAPRFLLFAAVFFGLCWIRWGPRTARHTAIPTTAALALFGFMDLYVVLRIRRVTRTALQSQHSTPPLPNAQKLGTRRMASAPLVMWCVCFLGVSLLWAFGEHSAPFSDPKLDLAHLWWVAFLWGTSCHRARRQMKTLRAAVGLPNSEDPGFDDDGVLCEPQN
jgi:hypothetical protein